jgi:hypothetical protein
MRDAGGHVAARAVSVHAITPARPSQPPVNDDSSSSPIVENHSGGAPMAPGALLFFGAALSSCSGPITLSFPMPRTQFASLPDNARVWVFASDRPISGNPAGRLLADVDRFLEGWQAHGLPLTSARDWRDDRFLTIAVDQRDAHASGCSIDGLFRSLSALESVIGASFLGAGGRVFYRKRDGSVASVGRDEFAELAAKGTLRRQSPVFDTTVTTLGDWRDHFETELGKSWHKELVGKENNE